MKKLLLILLVGILLLGAGVLFYILTDPSNLSLKSPLQPTPTPPLATPTIASIVKDQDQIKKTVNDFYTAYLECIKNPPPEAIRPFARYCEEQSEVITDEFHNTLKTTRGQDPILCSNTVPTSVTYESVDFESPERANAILVTLFGGFAKKIAVTVVRDNTRWRIDGVSCTLP
jgi:hypothetical protein